MTGNFNFYMNAKLDKLVSMSNKNDNPDYRREVCSLLDTLDLLDVWRVLNPNIRRYTWHSRGKASRLDYVFMSDHLCNSLANCRINPGIHSDHWCKACRKDEWDQMKQIPTAWVEKLVKCGDINTQDIQGLTALHHVARGCLYHRDEPCGSDNGNRHGDCRAVWERNPLPIPIGAEAGMCPSDPDLDIVKLLLDHGSDPYILDNQGWTCIQHAEYHGHQHITRILQDHTQMPTNDRNKGNVTLHVIM